MTGPVDPAPAGAAPRDDAPDGIDPRGPRVVAGITSLLLAVTILLWTSTAALVLLAVVAASFAIGAVAGAQHTWQAAFYRLVVLPRIGPTDEREDPAPPRFAQAVGLGFALVAVAGYVAGVPLLGAVATGAALAAAFLNAAFGFCLGCELYLLLLRWSRSGKAARLRTTTH